MTEFTRGDRVGDLVLVRRLGAGTHGETWLADDASRARRVALKIPAMVVPRERVQREADVQRDVAHPAIAVVHGLVDLADGRVGLVQEYLPGGDLAQLRGRPWPQVLTAVRPALDALVAMADAGVAHGDLKPANLVRDEAGVAKLVDFGVAAFVAPDAAGTAPAGAPTGSPYSRSPAQWRGGLPTPTDDAYGFGALLYELLAGHPPYYPNVSQGRVEHEAVPPLHAPHPVPEELLALVDGLLAKDPAARTTLAAARTGIERLLATAPAASIDASVPLAVPPKLAPPSRATAPAWKPTAPVVAGRTTVVGGETPAASRGRSPVALALGGALVLALLGVFVVLPRWVEKHPVRIESAEAGRGAAARTGSVSAGAAGGAAPGASGATANRAAAPGGAPAVNPLPSDPAALAALAQAKTRAEDARGAYDAALKPLAEARAELWGGADWAQLQAAGGAAKQQYEARDYAGAAVTWTSGLDLAGKVQAARAPALAAALAAGREGLERSDSRAALAGFDRALEIEPKNAVATAGRTRAQNLDRVLALVDEGTNLERAGQPSAASEKYKSALAIDPLTTAATAGLARIAAQARRDAYAQAMAQGQRALASGNREAARAAFERARSIDGTDASARDAIAQVDDGERTAKLAALRTQAETAERAERWADAVKTYDTALALDATVAFAQQGRARAQPRADLARRIDAYLHRPDALDDPDERATARQLLAAAADVPGDAPALRRQQQALDAALRAAETPVRLALASDNQTEVLVYRVGKLGAFQSRELELLPGRYTIVGRRPGFRDVRREVVLPPGGTSAPVEIRCTDPI